MASVHTIRDGDTEHAFEVENIAAISRTDVGASIVYLREGGEVHVSNLGKNEHAALIAMWQTVKRPGNRAA